MRYRFFLYGQLLKRDIESRYRGSMLGLAWPLLQPLSQLAVFTLIFFEFMQFRWPMTTGQSGQSAWDYAAQVLAGLAAFNFFAELLNRSPSSISSQSNFVTKLRFPLALLPAVNFGSAMLHLFTATLVLTLYQALTLGLSFDMLIRLGCLPVLMAPFVIYGLGLSLILSGLGVYFRDLQQVMPAITSLLMFLSPIFYPASAVPLALRPWFEFNPIGAAAEAMRYALLPSSHFQVDSWLWHGLSSLVFIAFSVVLFRRIRPGFADVL